MTRRAPWWAWGFVAGAFAAFLGLVTHWFSTVPPGSAPSLSGGHSYGAFSVEWLGVLGPVFMLLEGGRWFGALRGWWRVPALADWRRGRTAEADPEPGEGAGPGALIGLATLALLGICRAAVPTHHTVIAIGGSDPGRRDYTYAVHADFGLWCMLVACALFTVSGAVGWFTRERLFPHGRPATT
ncbi:hypothetical protein ABZ901_14245 [Actinacidiphila alni]|uniref:hypothetical protein n=1 Tax=Actinacidiphila alni TaxID=380248 RepID=UPI003400B278